MPTAEFWRIGRPGGRIVSVVTIRKFGSTIVVMFLIISFWSNPSGSAVAFGEFLADVGGFFSTVINKSAEFTQGLLG